jgi:hypothetical protein
MTLPPRTPPPRLTEVLRLDLEPDTAAIPAPAVTPAAWRHEEGGDDALQAALFVEPLLEDIVHRLDRVLELRLRDALAPELERLADRVVQAARDEVAIGLRELVERAVTEELARRRGS